MELTVVGNGVAGSALTRIARSRGHRVRLISFEEPAASAAALAVIKRSWLPKEVDWNQLRQHYQLATETRSECLYTTYRRPDAQLFSEAWLAVEPTSYLLPANEVRSVSFGWDDPRSQFTVHAVGAELPGQRTYGHTWFAADPAALDGYMFRVHEWAPYRSLDAVSFVSGCRLGSSTGMTEEASLKAAYNQLALARQLGWTQPEVWWSVITGMRLRRPNIIEQESKNVWSFGGFHRSGYGLAPHYAQKLVEALEDAS